ncbi:MAG: HAD hydrolase-like protein, partial [Clostridiales bacterium]|nr:HAD hydrolase-like protein [Clostridiales bacterium]
PVAIGQRPDVRRKPAPDAVEEALRQLGRDRSEAVYVGDSEVDLYTARNARMDCISVTWGFRDRELLDSEGATRYADTPAEVLNWL